MLRQGGNKGGAGCLFYLAWGMMGSVGLCKGDENEKAATLLIDVGFRFGFDATCSETAKRGA